MSIRVLDRDGRVLRPVSPARAEEWVTHSRARWLVIDGGEPNRRHGTIIVLKTVDNAAEDRPSCHIYNADGELLGWTHPDLINKYLSSGERLKGLRVRAGMSESQVAKSLGVTRDTVVEWELSQNGLPSEAAALVTGLFDMPLKYLIAKERVILVGARSVYGPRAVITTGMVSAQAVEAIKKLEAARVIDGTLKRVALRNEITGIIQRAENWNDVEDSVQRVVEGHLASGAAISEFRELRRRLSALDLLLDPEWRKVRETVTSLGPVSEHIPGAALL